MFLINSCVKSLAAARQIIRRKNAWQGLSRSYTCCFAEFLNVSLLDHLGLLDLPTSVGLRYGKSTFSLPRIFSSVEISRITSTKWKHSTSLLVNSNGFTCQSINLQLVREFINTPWISNRVPPELAPPSVSKTLIFRPKPSNLH